MLQALYTALSGLATQQYNIDVIGNNIANINTTAFKSNRTDFADTLYLQMQQTQAASYLQNGTGITVGAVQRSTDVGTPQATGSSLDFMLSNQGYFAVQGSGGQLYYTRDGSFKVSMEKGTGYLVTANGDYVLDTNNQRIKMPGDTSSVAADSAGNLSIGGTKIASMKIVSFVNPLGLADAGENKYTATAASGTAATAKPTVLQGWLEGSNVDMATEMSNLMRAQKIYAAMGSAIRTADDMESQANSMSK
jgi:flagellar basal-body rod protein FlgG